MTIARIRYDYEVTQPLQWLFRKHLTLSHNHRKLSSSFLGGMFALLVGLFVSGCSQDPIAIYQNALDAYRQQDYAQSTKLLRQSLATNSDLVPAYLLLGRIAEDENQPDSANLNYRNAIDILSRRDFQLQTEDLQALELEPSIRWEEAVQQVAETHFKKGEYDQVRHYYGLLAKHTSEDSWRQRALNASQLASEFQGYHARLGELRAQNIQSPGDPRIESQIAELLMEMTSALSRAGKADSVADLANMANHFRLQAQDSLQRIYESTPEMHLPATQALLSYVESQLQLLKGRFNEALESAQRACDLYPSDARFPFAVANIMAVLSVRNKDTKMSLDKRMEYTRKALELSPRTWRYLLSYGGLLHEDGQTQEAYRYIRDAYELCDDPNVKGEIGRMLARLELELAKTAAK